ncbi:hypothetical protein PTKIN_Ptkin06aG0188800 [Pterospermum kingtungense]
MAISLLPHDIIIDILGNLPVTSLLRFKSVSKVWFSSITTPGFVEHHLSNQHKKAPRFMMATTGHTYLDYTYCCRKELLLGSIFVNGDVHESITLGYGWKFITDLPNDGYFLSHCDGILCLYGCFNIHLFNPCTNECRTLPQGNFVSCHFTDLGAHNPRVQVHIGEWHRKLVQLGFGRDQATKQYKIVKVFNLDLYDKSHPDLCEIFTLDSNPRASWKILGVVPYRIALSATPVHVNGAI